MADNHFIKERGISAFRQGKEVTLCCSSANQLLNRVEGEGGRLCLFLKASSEPLLFLGSLLRGLASHDETALPRASASYSKHSPLVVQCALSQMEENKIS